MRRRQQVLAPVVLLACLAAWGGSRSGLARGDDGPVRQDKAPAPRAARPAARGATTWTTVLEPKPLNGRVRAGLDWLVQHQLPRGGWGEGEESAQVLRGLTGDSFREPPNVADTCIASLALIRSGSTPREGPYRGAIFDGVGFVRSQVEQSDATSLSVTSVQGTRDQMKLGPNIDTYLASMLLSEVRGSMPDEAGERAVAHALDKVIDKIERHLAKDGPSEDVGWAPVLAQAMAAKGLNRARQAGARVSDMALAQMEDAARIAQRTGAWPRAIQGARPMSEILGRAMEDMSRSREMGAVRAGHRAHRRPRTTDGAASAVDGSSRSLGAGAGDDAAGRGSMLTSAGPAPSSSAGEGTSRDRESAGRRSMLGGAGPSPSPASAGDVAKGGEDGGRRPEPSAAGPDSPSHRARRRRMVGTAGFGAAPAGRTVIAMAGGLPLYSGAACLGILQDSLNTGRAEVPRLRDLAARSLDPNERAGAERRLARIADAEEIQRGAQAALVARLDQPGFLGGFGLHGGEEFLSYMTIAEGLAAQGGDTWRRWDSRMSEDLYRLQDADGSWSGSHCITGRTFCTAAALLTLMADRTPVPVPARATTSASDSR